MIGREKLHELLDFDFATGKMVWKVRPTARPQWNARYAGKEADKRVNAFNSKIRADGKSGVSWFKPRGLWRAYLTNGGKQMHIGYYETLEGAAAARDCAYHAIEPKG